MQTVRLFLQCTCAANGMHVRFDSEMNAARALAKSGQVVDGNVMIGVAKYEPDKYQACFFASRG